MKGLRSTPRSRNQTKENCRKYGTRHCFELKPRIGGVPKPRTPSLQMNLWRTEQRHKTFCMKRKYSSRGEKHTRGGSSGSSPTCFHCFLERIAAVFRHPFHQSTMGSFNPKAIYLQGKQQTSELLVCSIPSYVRRAPPPCCEYFSTCSRPPLTRVCCYLRC